MKWQQVAGTAAVMAVTAIVAARYTNHSPKEPPGSTPFDAEMMERWMQFASPGDHHRKLDLFVGSWDQTVRWWIAPEIEPTVSTGTATYEWIMGGRFVQGIYGGEAMGQPFEGLDLLGYDNVREEYVSLWIDNHSTAFMLSRGCYHEDRKALEMHGRHDDMLTGQRDKEFRTITTFVSDDEIMFEMHGPGLDGRTFKLLEVHSRRRG